MIELLNIPEEFQIRHKNPQNLIEHIFSDTDSEMHSFVSKVEWVASIKPGIADTTPVRTKTIRYDEIEVIFLEIEDTQELYNVCVPICKSIVYPCLLVIQFQDRFLLGVCPFTAGKLDYDKNVLSSMIFSHWIFPDLLSRGAQKLISAISAQIVAKGDVKSIYVAMKYCIQDFQLRGISKPHVIALTKDLVGRNCERAYRSCVPYKMYLPVGPGIRAKYSARSDRFNYRYDTEDLWHAYMTDEMIRGIIEKRGYRDIEDLIWSIDSKYEDCST